MATSYTTTQGDGVQTEFVVSFPYLSRDHVFVKVDGVITTFAWVSAGLVNVSPAPAGLVRVLRDSQTDDPLVDFVMPSVLTESDLDTAYLHSKFLAEEAVDRANESILDDGVGNWDADGKRITNVGAAVDDSDVATKGYVDDIRTETSADAAVAVAAKVAALAAQAASEAALDSFDDRYLGPKSADPVLDNDGNALLTGALYWNSTIGVLKTYTGSIWSTNLPVNIVVDTFDGDGTTLEFELSVDPGSENATVVTVAGLLQHKGTYSIVGTMLTFSEAPATGADNIEVINLGIAQAIGVPSDRTVSRVKLGLPLAAGIAINVKEYGAVGDGAADDTAAFTAAITAIAAGGAVHVPQGTFVTGGLTLNKAMSFVMDPGAIIKLRSGVGVNLITITASDVVVRGGVIDGNRNNQSGSVGHGIISSGVDRVLIENVEVKNTKECGIYLRDGDDLITRKCYVHHTTDTGIQFFATGDSLVRPVAEDHVVDRSDDATNNGGCIKMTNNSGGTLYKIIGASIRNNRVKMSNAPSGTDVVALEIWCDTDGGAARNCAMNDNYVEGSDIGCSLARVHSGVMSGNTVFDAASISLEFARSPHCAMTGNTVQGNSNTPAGISINETSTYATVTGNTVRDCTHASNGGIYFDTLATNGSCLGNTIYNCPGGGITINGASEQVIVGNYVNGNAAGIGAGVALFVCSDIVVTGNRVEGVPNGVSIVVNTATTQNRISIMGNVLAGSSNPYIVTLSGGGAIGNNIMLGFNTGMNVGSDINYLMLDYLNNMAIDVGTTNDPSATFWGQGSLFMTRKGVARSAWIKEAASGQTAAGWNPIQTIYASTTANRQTLGVTQVGYMQFDTTLGKPIWWNGTLWKDATGTTV